MEEKPDRHHQLSGPAVHVYKEGRLYIKSSFLRGKRPCSVNVRGTTLSLSEGAERRTKTFNLENAKLLTQKATRRLIIQLASKERLSLYAQDSADFAEWVDILSDSIHWKIQRFYDFGEELGKGAFATVTQGWYKPTGDPVAIKIIGKKTCSDEDLKYLQREIDIAQSLHHPNIVRTSDLFESDNHLYIVLEYVGGGTLQSFRSRNGSPSEDTARCIMRDILTAVQHIHSKSIVHRDIKPENMLCTESESPTRVKLMDFGLARSLTSIRRASVEDVESDEGLGPDGLMTTPVGTPSYVAPEILMSLPYGKEVDLFACGVVMYWLLCGYLPFDDSDPQELMALIKKTEFAFPDKEWEPVSEDAKHMIRGLLDRSPYARLTASQALEHPWLCQVVTEANAAGQLACGVSAETLRQEDLRPPEMAEGARTLSQQLSLSSDENEGLQVTSSVSEGTLSGGLRTVNF